MKSAETKMLTVRDVAEKLDANPGTVRMWCINKTFPNAVQEETLRGPVWLIPESDLKSFEKRGPGRPSKQATAAPPDTKSEIRRADKTAQKLNQAFRKAAEDGQQAGKKKGGKK